MNTRLRSILVIGTLLSVPAHAATIIPLTGGQAIGAGSGYENIAPFFDSQPAAVPTVGPTVDLFGGIGGFFADSGRGFYFDFGTSYGSVTISDVYVGLKLNGTNSSGVVVSYFWSSDTNVNYDPLSGDTPAPDFNLFTFTGNTAEKSWQQIYDGVDVVPQGRYYIGRFSGATTLTNRMEEIAFVGAVPEPGAAGLIAITVAGATCLIRRRGNRQAVQG